MSNQNTNVEHIFGTNEKLIWLSHVLLHRGSSIKNANAVLLPSVPCGEDGGLARRYRRPAQQGKLLPEWR